MLNIAQIGIGYWGPNLLRNLIANKRCEVTKVVDLSAERRDYVKSLYPAVKTLEDFNEVIDDDSVDAVVISTPVATHYDFAMKALEKGKHILVEKPIATSVKEVIAMGEFASKNNLIVMAGHTFLFNAAVRYVKKLIDYDKSEIQGARHGLKLWMLITFMLWHEQMVEKRFN